MISKTQYYHITFFFYKEGNNIRSCFKEKSKRNFNMYPIVID